MRISSGKPAHYAGFADLGRRYDAGAIVIYRGNTFVSRVDQNPFREPSKDWVPLGPYGASPTTVTHRWHPQTVMYPAGDADEMSEPTDACSDCWKDADYRNAFRPEVHLYVIRELGL